MNTCTFWKWRVMARNMNNTRVMFCVLSKVNYEAAYSIHVFVLCGIKMVGDGIVCLGVQL